MSNVAQIEDYQEDDNSSGLAKERLKSFVERVERLEEEKQTIMDDMKEILA